MTEMDNRCVTLINGKIITPHRIVMGGYITLRGSRVEIVSEEPLSLDEEKPLVTPGGLAQALSEKEGDSSDIVVDVDGAYIIPGLIDLHLHGAGNADVMDGGTECIETVARVHARGGVTAFLPTTISCSHEMTMKLIADAREVMGKSCTDGARVLGVHLEGPYLDREQAGAHDLSQVRIPDQREWSQWLEQNDVVRRMTVAPELPGALELGRELARRGIIASMGHTKVLFEDVERALDAGYSHVTHYLCSISQSVRLKDKKIAGLAEAALAYDDVSIELIADNMHLPPGIPKMVYQCKGPDKTVLITDAIRATGMPDGEYQLGDKLTGRKIIVDQGVAWVPDRTVFAGSVSMGNRLIRNVVETSHIPIADAVRMMSLTPARMLGIEGRKGILAPGMDADVVVMRPDYSVVLTFVEGRCVWSDAEAASAA